MKPHALPQRGLSMIELAVVTTLLALLLVMLGPEVGRWIRNVQIRTTAESVQHGVHLARAEAMRRNRSVRFSLVNNLTDACTVSSKASSWIVSLDDPSGQCAVAPSEVAAPRIIALRDSNEGGTHVSVNAMQADDTKTADSVAFDGFGRLVGATGIARVDVDNVQPGNDYRALRITINAAGNVRLCDPKLSTTSDDPRRCY